MLTKGSPKMGSSKVSHLLNSQLAIAYEHAVPKEIPGDIYPDAVLMPSHLAYPAQVRTTTGAIIDVDKISRDVDNTPHSCSTAWLPR